MKTRFFICMLVVVLFAGVSFSQDEETSVVSGVIEEIADDGSYLVVDNTKISTTMDFIEEAFFEVGDEVEITVEKSGDILRAVDFEYVFEDEPQEEESPDTGE